MSGSHSLIPLLLAFALLHALPASVANAQQPAALPQIRFVNHRSVLISNMYLCSGAEWVSCRTKTAAKIRDAVFYLYPERDNLGGQQIRRGDSGDLGGVASFALFVRFDGKVLFWREYLVEVQTGVAVAAVAPVGGTVQASGAMAPVNGLTVTGGESMFGIVPPVPAAVDLHLWVLLQEDPQPGAPGVVITVKAGALCDREDPRCR